MNKQVRFIARNSWLWNRCAEHENTRVETRREKKKVRKQNERMKEKGKGEREKRKRGKNTERGIDYCLPPRINYRSYRCHPSWLHPVRVTPRALINNSFTDPRFHLMPAATTTLSSHRRQVKKKFQRLLTPDAFNSASTFWSISFKNSHSCAYTVFYGSCFEMVWYRVRYQIFVNIKCLENLSLKSFVAYIAHLSK